MIEILRNLKVTKKKRTLQADNFDVGDNDFNEDDNDNNNGNGNKDDGNEDDDDNDLNKVQERDFEVFELSQPPVPFGFEITTILIRKSYTDLFNIVILHNHHTLVTGNSGIGKTLFMLYVLYRLRDPDVTSENGKTFILGFSKQSIYYIIRDDVVQRYESDFKVIQEIDKDKIVGKDIYFLFDCGTKGALRPSSA